MLKRGFTLLEVLVGLGLFGILALSLSNSLLFFLRTNTVNQYRTGAVQAVQVVLDQLRSIDPMTLPTTAGATQTRSVSVDGLSTPYTVTITYCANPVYCTTNDLRHISVSAVYDGREYYGTETVYTQLR
jgi:prepilin-type N-terminal cleavage/methylation domain-containing protein